MSTILRSPAALLAREVAVITAFREAIRPKAAHELVVVVVYPFPTGPYRTRQATGVLGADGQEIVRVIRVNAMGIRLADKPKRSRTDLTISGGTVTQTIREDA